MQKPAALRAVLTAALPELARDPDRLRMWVESGKVRCPMTSSRNFGWEYTLNLLITEWTGHPSVLALLVNDWLRDNQPDLCQPGGESGYGFEADILDAESFDIQLALRLTEPVAVSPRVGGGWTIDHPGEPAPLFPDEEPLAEPPSRLTAIWAGGVQLVPAP